MTPEQLNAWFAVATLFVHLGGELNELFHAGGLTEEQQAQILDALQDDNARRRAISAAEAGL